MGYPQYGLSAVEMFTALCLNRALPEEVFAFAELGVQLVIEVVSVCNDYDCRL